MTACVVACGGKKDSVIGDMVEAKLDWEWLYGELEPGNYRITKTVNQEDITAYFVLN